MNKISVDIDFTKGTLVPNGINLITGDYNSTEIDFTFDEAHQEGIKEFEMKSPSGTVVFVDRIVDNQIILTGKDENDNNVSLFDEAGYYIFEISYRVGESKLTSVSGKLPVQQEQVVIGDEIVEPYLPIFERLMQDVSVAITETNNLDLDANKVDTTTTVVLTKKDGTTKTIEILDGEKGDKGDKGDAGAIKMLIVAELPATGADDTIYLVPITPDTTGNNYAEYVYINGAWELLGKIGVQVDLTDYVKNTDYATAQKGGVVKANMAGFNISSSGIPSANVYNYTNYVNTGDGSFVGKGTLENVITGKGLTTKSYVDGLVGNIQTLLDNLDTGAGV